MERWPGRRVCKMRVSTGAKNYAATRVACYIGLSSQAVVNNLPPLLFVTFQTQFGLSLGQLGLLVTVNFVTQLLVDLLAVRFADKIGYRIASVAAQFFCCAGMFCLGTLPFVMPVPYWGLLIAIIINAVGGGLIEVIVSPIIEALPGDKKAASMSLLHSFYCWGSVAVVVLSTLYMRFAGERWTLLPMLWALVPLACGLMFTRVPLRPLPAGENGPMPMRRLLGKRLFLLMVLLMMCSGASEQAMSQWASLFAEAGLGVSKTLGDLLGPCAFAVLMGLSRVLLSMRGRRIDLEKTLLGGGALCVCSYLLAVFSPWPLLSLVGCALCGLAVGVMWPGTCSLAARHFPGGGTAMFALLALAGDAGCASGPGLVGLVSGLVQQQTGSGENEALKAGLLCAIIFPVLLALGVGYLKRRATGGQTVTEPEGE